MGVVEERGGGGIEGDPKTASLVHLPLAGHKVQVGANAIETTC